MGIFRKNPENAFLRDRTKRRENLTFNSEAYGHCLMKAGLSAASIMIENYVDQRGNYYFMPDGSIHIWSKDSFDEMKSKRVSEWGFGYGDNFPEYLCFRLEMMGFTFVIQETLNGNALTWLSARFPDVEKDSLGLI